MPDERLPNKVFYGEIQEGKRSQCGQKRRYKDTLKASLKDFDIPLGSTGVIKVARSHQHLYEEKKICEAERRHRERKAKTK